MENLEIQLTIPDQWQRQSLEALKAGRDVIVSAPTGAGKTFIFEQIIGQGFRGKAVFTVPTRALANDKLFEWRTAGWNVGIMTGDVAENMEAPVVVATLETQRSRLLRGEGPDLLVIDEYQMLSDPSRGVNYELAIALAPEDTQLLLLSGSVANPQKVVSWLQKMGRDAVLIDHQERPVPQEEVFFDALPDHLPKRIHGFWIRKVAKALAADLGPVLVFAPRRRASEDLARQLAGALPQDDPLLLTDEQKGLAGSALSRLLKNRVAFHHSGLSYQQRAGLIEPLAKAGQLRVVVATTGLAAGINFCMRSVVVTDREYRVGDLTQLIRPDELLQMFGRAGRRGMDDRGYILVAEGKPRFQEASPLLIRRTNQVDWPAFISVMRQAVLHEENPADATDLLLERLFSDQQVPIGLRDFLVKYESQPRIYEDKSGLSNQSNRREIIEMQNSEGKWERRPGPSKTRLSQAQILYKGQWRPALTVAKTLAGIQVGSLCRIHKEGRRYYGREIPLAQFPEDTSSNQIKLFKWVRKGLRTYFRETRNNHGYPPEFWDLDDFEKEVLPLLPVLTSGGHLIELVERKGQILAKVEYDRAEIFAYIDSVGAPLLNPPLRKTEHDPLLEFAHAPEKDPLKERIKARKTPAEIWYRLKLIDNRGHPTRRGTLFSFFHQGEGLAVAAALEDERYPVEDLVWDIANLRAGHRFDTQGQASGRLRMICRHAYGLLTYEGYLKKGLPTEYGEGASEILREMELDPSAKYSRVDDELRTGDIERVELEWRSLLNHVAHAPDYDWDRWLQFRLAVRNYIADHPAPNSLLDVPKLTREQQVRHQTLVRFQ